MDRPKDQETGSPNSDIVLDAYFRTSDGVLIDPDSAPTYEIFTPSAVSADTGTSTKVSTGKYSATFSIPSDAVLSDSWKIVWTTSINGSSISNFEYFTVASDAGSIDFGSPVIISDSHMKRIKSVLLYPKVTNLILTDEEIKTLCVLPALEEYFSKFPIEVPYESSISTNESTDIDFPDEDTFGVIDARIVDKGYGSGNASFFDIIKFQNMSNISKGGKAFGGKYGTKYRFSSYGRTEQYLKQQLASTMENKSTVKFYVTESERKITFYSEVSGTLNITWAKKSLNFNNIKFVYVKDVLDLCKSNLLQHYADTMSAVSEATPLDPSAAADTADKLRTRVEEKWIEIPDVILIR